ncbi:hypothetical protein M409DRAFT_27481 [Zasmidium cellare ATCC 36951]|uniref:F-box domain-containing protein n=1 Tax=Zasmidium cellare ATCC 36951 TaxID=1080233 RepID=A0A6A6C4Z3_ZASCE|nr:uncharacterized protein M409DRAFT_27481 [Zasmidium cellare ATCC 36951]KAF2162101.1 hypothetical protein M409DRAFT_27481 [Zasmidium cellare ATCC 36951]
MATALVTPSIRLLNPDVFREVFLRLSKYDLLDVVCVCWEWNHVARRLIDQMLEIVASVKMQEANLRLLRRLQQDSDLRHRVKDLVVKDWYLDDLPPWPKIGSQFEDPWISGKCFSTTYIDDNSMSPDSRDLMQHMCCALALMNLSSFTWSALSPMPITLFEVLASRPSCDIHIRRSERAYEVAVWSHSPIINHLQLRYMTRVASQLTTLELLLPSEDPLILSSLGRLVVLSPRLKSLKIYTLGKLWGGSKVHFVFTRPSRGTVFAPVRSMEWLQSPLLLAGRQLALETLELDNFCVCRIRDFALSSITDVSKLRRIGLSCFSFLRNGPCPLNIRSFRLHCHNPAAFEDQYCEKLWTSSEVQEMVSRCYFLTEVELLDGADILSGPVLERLGKQLTGLRLRQVIWPNSVSSYDLDAISKTCPSLRALDIDIPNAKLFSRFSSEVTTLFPRLERLTVCRGSEGHLIVDFFTPDPHRCSATLADLRATWDEMAAGESNLVELTLHFGFRKAWDRDITFFTTGRPYAAQAEIGSRSHTAQADLPARLVGDKQQVETRCVEIDEARKAIAHRWQWLDGFFVRQNSWEERLNHLDEVAVRGLYLVRRRTPNAQGEFTQRAM